MAMAYQNSPKSEHIFHWMCSGLCFLVSNIAAIISIELDVANILHPGLANVFYMLGHAFITTGVAQYVYGKYPKYLAPAIAAFTLLLHFNESFIQSVDVRFISLTPIVVMLCGASMTMLWQHRHEQRLKLLLPLLLTQAVFVIQMVGRTFAQVSSDFDLHFFANDWLQTAGSLAVITYICTLSATLIRIIDGEKQRLLVRQTNTDYLTGWLNRTAMEKSMSRRFEQFIHTGHAFGVIVFDIDHFKQVNDTWGHHVGDIALQKLCDVAKDIVRGNDNCFRVGGEEFAIIVDRCSDRQLAQISERLRRTVAKFNIQCEAIEFSATISIGTAMSNKGDASWKALFNRADDALYQSKSSGRNSVTSATASFSAL